MDLMERGSRNRAVAGTSMNERSSRSHQVLTIIVDGTNRLTGATTHACLHLVDLAGSERVKQSKVGVEVWTHACLHLVDLAGSVRVKQSKVGGAVLGIVKGLQLRTQLSIQVYCTNAPTKALEGVIMNSQMCKRPNTRTPSQT